MENYFLSSLKPKCPFCGLSRKKFSRYGKLGCKYCLESFEDIIQKFYEKLYFFPFQVGGAEKEELLPFYENAEKKGLFAVISELRQKGISIRLRIARNISNFPYPIHRSVSKLRIISFLKEKKITQSLPEEYSLYYLDEDHVRLSTMIGSEKDLQNWEINTSALNHPELFEFSSFGGYINSCPSNCGKGTKISVRLKLPALIQRPLLFKKLVPLSHTLLAEGEVIMDRNSVLTLYYKNPSNAEIRQFLFYAYALREFNESLE
ncbi:MAG: hypothetical protein H7A25_18255 [Leptospiraceae bacterium]|nr:hypothetical protein [Leptospiraceae bacterium]MCP5501851.1 hypothetical protein [Leptospiraceae bacterium]